MDDLEEAIDRLTTAIDALRREIADRSDGARKMVGAFLVSVSTACVLLALNLLLGVSP